MNHLKITYPTCSRVFIALLFVFCSLASRAQDTLIIDSTVVQPLKKPSKFSEKWNMQPHSPMKATIYSAVLPGAGQVYNKKWWKTLIVYAGIGTGVYFVKWNDNNYLTYRRAYIAAIDNDPNTVPSIEGDAAFFNQWQDQHRRWRDVSYMALLGIYVLQLIDANVDAHLFYYDVSPDIQLRVQPSVVVSDRIKPGLGISINF